MIHRQYPWLIVGLAVLLSLNNGWCESRANRTLSKMNASKDEMISMTKTLSFKDALKVFDDIAKRKRSKIIVDPTNTDGPIGVDIDNMYWLDAFELILQNLNLEYEEYNDHYLLKKPEKAVVNERYRSSREMYESREVVISALFFESNSADLNQMGSSWNIVDKNGLIYNMTSADNKTGQLQINGVKGFSFADLTAVFKAMASQQIGDILANPQVVVQSGSVGRIQIGSDFSQTTQDFSGNTITQFFSTGSIITVTPEVITLEMVEDTATFIHLQLEVERSNAASSELGLEVKRTSARTSILLLDGEETMIGGLHINEDSKTREGVPFLKDLPWWCLGLRYLFGYYTTNLIQKELTIVIRADLVPTLEERIQARLKGLEEVNIFEKGLNEYRDRFGDYLKQKERHEP